MSKRSSQLPGASMSATFRRLLDEPYHAHQHPQLAGERLTVVALVFTPNGELLFVLPRQADRHGWIPPQGGVQEGESLQSALRRELGEECRYGVRVVKEVHYIGHSCSRNSRGETKRLVGLFVPLMSWQAPVTNGENRKWCLASCWDKVADLMSACSEPKKLAVNVFLSTAFHEIPHFRHRWGLPTQTFRIAMPNGCSR